MGADEALAVAGLTDMQRSGFRADFARIARFFDISDFEGGDEALKDALAGTPYGESWRMADWAPLCLRASLRWAATRLPKLFASLIQLAERSDRTVGLYQKANVSAPSHLNARSLTRSLHPPSSVQMQMVKTTAMSEVELVALCNGPDRLSAVAAILLLSAFSRCSGSASKQALHKYYKDLAPPPNGIPSQGSIPELYAALQADGAFLQTPNTSRFKRALPTHPDKLLEMLKGQPEGEDTQTQAPQQGGKGGKGSKGGGGKGGGSKAGKGSKGGGNAGPSSAPAGPSSAPAGPSGSGQKGHQTTMTQFGVVVSVSFVASSGEGGTGRRGSVYLPSSPTRPPPPPPHTHTLPCSQPRASRWSCRKPSPQP